MLRNAAASIAPDDPVVLETWSSPVTVEMLRVQVESTPNGVLVAPLNGWCSGVSGLNLRADEERLLTDIAVAALSDEDWCRDRDGLRAQIASLLQDEHEPSRLLVLLNQETADDLRIRIHQRESQSAVPAGVYAFPSPEDDPRYAAALFTAANFNRLDVRTFRALGEPLALAVPPRPRKNVAAQRQGLSDEVLTKAQISFLRDGFAALDAASGGPAGATAASGVARARAWFRDRPLLHDVFLENLKLRLEHGNPDSRIAAKLRGLEIESLSHAARTGLDNAGPLARLIFGYLASSGPAPSGAPAGRDALLKKLRASIDRSPAILSELKAALPGADLKALTADLTRFPAAEPAYTDLLIQGGARLFWTLYLHPMTPDLRPDLSDFAPSDTEPLRDRARIVALVAELSRVVAGEPVSQPDAQALLTGLGRRSDLLLNGDLPDMAVFGFGLSLGLLQPLREVRWQEVGTFDLEGAAASSVLEAACKCTEALTDRSPVLDVGDPIDLADGQIPTGALTAFLTCRSVLEVATGCGSLGKAEGDAIQAFTTHLFPFAEVAFNEEPLWRLERGGARSQWIADFEAAMADLQRGAAVAVAMLLCGRPGAQEAGEVAFTLPDDLREWLRHRPSTDGVWRPTRAADMYARVQALGRLSDQWAAALQAARIRPSDAGRAMWTHRRTALRRFAETLRALTRSDSKS